MFFRKWLSIGAGPYTLFCVLSRLFWCVLLFSCRLYRSVSCVADCWSQVLQTDWWKAGGNDCLLSNMFSFQRFFYHLITVLLPLLVNCLLCLYKYIALIADYRNIKHILCLYGTSWIQTWILHRSIAPQHIVKSGSYITHGHDGSEGLQPVLNASWFLFLLSL